MTGSEIDPEEWEKFREHEGRKQWGKHCQDKVHKQIQSRRGHYFWEKEYRIHPNSQKAVDIGGGPKSRNHLVFIEIECQRTTCVRNILKVWMNMSEAADSQPVLFIQVFSPFFDEGGKRGKKESVFIGAKAQEDTRGKLMYKHIQLSSWSTDDETLCSLVDEIMGLVNGYESWRGD